MGYITDVYAGFSTNSGLCPFPSGTFLDGRDICDWSAQFTFETDPAFIANADLTGFRGQITEACMTTAQKTAFFARIRSDGGDLRMTLSDGSTEIPAYVHFIDTASEKVWFSWYLSGVLPGDQSTEFKVYVGNAAATAYPVGHSVGRNAVFQGFRFFFDMAQDPSGVAPQLTDLTGNAIDGTSQGGMASADLVTRSNGMRAWNFDRANSEYVTGSDASTEIIVANLPRRIGGWLTVALDGQFEFLFDYGTFGGTPGRYFAVFKSSSDDWRMNFSGHTVKATLAGAGTYKVDAVVPDVPNTKTDDVLLYINGVSVALTDVVGANETLNTTRRGDWDIATNVVNTVFNNLDTGPVYFSGEVSADWLSTEWNNQNDPASFISCTSVFFN